MTGLIERPAVMESRNRTIHGANYTNSVDIAALLRPDWVEFANEYIRNGGKQSTAWLDTIGLNYTDEIQASRNDKFIYAISRAKAITKNVLVIRYINLKRKEIARDAALDSERSYAGWLRKMQEIRDAAFKDCEYSPAIRAHELVGKAEGHIDRDQHGVLSSVSDGDLIRQMAEVLGDQSAVIAKLMGINDPVIVDADIVSDDR